MTSRYAGIVKDEGDSEGEEEGVDECIEKHEGDGGEGERSFLDMMDDFDDLDDDVDDADLSIISTGGQNEEDDNFDMIIGALEEIMMDEKFQQLQEEFVYQFYSQFDDGEENKLIYTEIFAKYTELIEGHVERSLKESLPDFSMQSFMEILVAREEEMQGTDVFDMLVSFADFDTFKEIMLAHKHEREGSGVSLTVGVSHVSLHNL